MQRRARRRRGWVLAAGAVCVYAATLWGEDSAPPSIVALVLDTSGSLTPAQLARARELALSVLESLPPESEVAVFTFDDQSRLVVPRTSEPGEVRRALAKVHVAGRYTALHDALYDASRYLREAPPARKAIVLATDGKDENSALNLDDGLRVAQETGVPVFAIGMGRVEERVLRRIAKLTLGSYLPVGKATGSMIAARIESLPAPQAAAAPVAAPPAAAPALANPRAGSSSSPAATGGPAVARTFGRLWMVLALAILVAVGAGTFFGLRRPATALCPTCGRELPNPDDPCPSCLEPEEEEEWRETDDTARPGQVSSTVMARLNTTEEYLEKTMVLLESPVLAVTRGPGSGQVFNLHSTTASSIGRAKANDIILQDVSVSSEHCRIRPLPDGRFAVHDLKSTNGTFVNERRVTRQTLTEGDVIKVGETYLQFRKEQKKTV